MKNDAKVAVVVNILYWGASKHKLMCLGFGARWVESYDLSLVDIWALLTNGIRVFKKSKYRMD